MTVDGKEIIYLVAQSSSNSSELFRVSLNEGTASPLIPNFPNGDRVGTFALSLDGQMLVYENSASRLFSVNLSSGTVVNLSKDLPADFRPFINGDRSLKIDARSERLVFQTVAPSFRLNGLFSVALNGQQLMRLTPKDSQDFSIGRDFLVTNDGLYAVYGVSDSSIFRNTIQLFRVPLDGSDAPVALTDRVESNDFFDSLTLTPDDAFILTSSKLISSNDSTELLKIPTFGERGIERLSQTFDSSFLFNGLRGSSVTVSPDGQFVIYLANLSSSQQQRLFRVPINGGEPEFIAPIDSSAEVRSDGLIITPNSQQILHIEAKSNMSLGFNLQLFAAPSVDIDTGVDAGSIALTTPLRQTASGDSFRLAVSPDSTRVAVVAPGRRSLLLAELPEQELSGPEEACFTIPAQNGRFAIVCL